MIKFFLKKKIKFYNLIKKVFIWHIKYLINHKVPPPILACGVYITNICNLKCKFCNIIRKKEKTTLSKKDGLILIEELSKMNCYYLSFSGGEPLLVPYIYELIEFAKKRGIDYIHLVSNGELINKNIAKKLNISGLSEISISLDGNQEYHDKIRAKKGLYEKVLKGIDNILDNTDIELVVNTIFSPFYPDQSLNVLKLVKKKGIKMKIQLLNQHPLFDMDDYVKIPPFKFNKLERENIINTIDELKKAKEVINSRPFLENLKRFLFEKERLMLSKRSCIYGYHHLEVLENGYFSPCLEGTEWKGLFPLKNGIQMQILQAQYKELLLKLKDCSRCLYNYYICYYEPRLNFPIWNFILYNVQVNKILIKLTKLVL